jgi:autotransporter-associated beta strand protein
MKQGSRKLRKFSIARFGKNQVGKLQDVQRKRYSLLTTAVGLASLTALGASQAKAGTISIVDGDFSALNLVPQSGDAGGGAAGNVPGWTTLGGFTGIFSPTTTQWAGTPGTLGTYGGEANLLALNGGANIYQQLTGTMVAGTTYNVQISYGWRSDIPQFEANDFTFVLRTNINHQSAFVASDSPAYQAGTAAGRQGYGDPAGAMQTTAPLPTGTGVLQVDTLTYTATAADQGQPLTIQLYDHSTQLDINDVSITQSSTALPNQLFWSGAASNVWDSTAADNFTDSNGVTSQFITSTDAVAFNDASIAGTPITNTSVAIQPGGVMPKSVVVGTSTVNYTFNDTDGVNGITGPTSLVKSGTSTLILNGSNSYTGGTQISNGAIQLGVNGALGTGTVSFIGDGTLQAGANITISNPITAAVGAQVFLDAHGNTLTLTGGLTNTGATNYPAILPIGAGNVIIAGTVSLFGVNNVGDYAAILLADNVNVNTTTITATGTVTGISSGWRGSVNTLNLAPAGTLNITNATDGIDEGQQSTASAGVINQTTGTINNTGNLILGKWDSSYGSFNLSGGTLNTANIQDGGQGNGNGNTYFQQTGGTLTVSKDVVTGYGGSGTNIFSQTAGTTTVGGNFWIANGGGSNGAATVSGGTLAVAGRVDLSSGSNTAVLNLNGGTTTVGTLTGVPSATNNVVNFNGGTLVAGTPVLGFPIFVSGVNGVIGAGGATFNTANQSVVISSNLSTTTNTSGLNSSVALSAAGTGYIGSPVVTITGGGGNGASGIATINPATGVVTGVTITSPGTGYTSAPTITLTGGGGTGATVAAYTPTVNTAKDGGLTKVGAGTLQLTGSNTYTGATKITAGTLQVAGAGTSVPIVNPNFNYHSPTNGGYEYNPPEPTGGWTYGNDTGNASEGAGVITGAFGFNTTGPIPYSSEAAFIQKEGYIQQTVNFPTAGNYTISFYSEQRQGYTGEQLDVYIDNPFSGGLDLASPGVSPSTNWQLMSFTFNETNPGSHLLTIQGVDATDNSGNPLDNTAYVTDVSLNAVYTGGSATNGVPDASAVVISDNATFDVNNSIETVGSLAGTSLSKVTIGTGALSVGGDGTNTSFAGTISGIGGTLTKIGTGNQTLTGSNSYSGGTIVNGGKLTFASPTALPLFTALSVGASGTAVAANFSTGTKNTLFVSSLTLAGSTGAWTGIVDLGNNDMVVRGGSVSTVTNQVASGFAGGTWQGSGGILSSAAAANPAHIMALGVIQNSVDGTTTGSALYSTFDGQTVTDADVLVKYTYYGDANLDGRVDGSDYTRIDAAFGADKTSPGSVTGWFNGDFNYDGKIDGSDYTLIDNAFNTQGAQVSSQFATSTAQFGGFSSSSVPEPATLGILTMGAVGLLGRRRRSR